MMERKNGAMRRFSSSFTAVQRTLLLHSEILSRSHRKFFNEEFSSKIFVKSLGVVQQKKIVRIDILHKIRSASSNI